MRVGEVKIPSNLKNCANPGIAFAGAYSTTQMQNSYVLIPSDEQDCMLKELHTWLTGAEYCDPSRGTPVTCP